MILATDVHYEPQQATAAGIGFDHWQATTPQLQVTSIIKDFGSYQPGKFYQRELPCLLTLLEDHQLAPEIIIIDGYVYLDGHSRAGLGMYLYDALDRQIPIIGVAKNRFKSISDDYALFRGVSENPLFITSCGIPPETVKSYIQSMHGSFRMPFLLKAADQLCRHPNIIETHSTTFN